MRRFFVRVWGLLRAEIVLGFLIATVFWAGVLGWQAANAPTDAQKQKCYDAAEHSGHKAEECKSLWERTTSDPVAFFTFWLVVSTIGLGVSTVMLWRAGEKQFRHARRSAAIQSRDMQASIAVARDANELNLRNFESVHRPKIRIKHLWLADELEPDRELPFRLAFVNIGTGVAQLRECGIRTFIVDGVEGLPTTPEFPAILGLKSITLLSGITMVMPRMTDGRILSATELEDIQGGSAVFICTGFVEYEDKSGIRKTAFCRKLQFGDNLEPGRFVATGDPDYEYED
jgi:hypothetical protein